MAKKKTKKNTLNKKGVTKATARPTHVVGESKNSPIGEVRRLLATAAFIREMWVARQIPQPVFDGDPTPLPSEEILGRRPTESEYAAATAILLADEFGHDRLWSEIVDKRELVAKALHLGIEPDELAAWIDIQHRTIPAATINRPAAPKSPGKDRNPRTRKFGGFLCPETGQWR